MEWQYGLHVSREARGYRATVLGYPSMRGEGPTREAAIQGARAAIREAMASGEIVSVTIDVPEPNPWVEHAGLWKDMPDEDWAAYQQAMQDYRREEAEDDAIV